mmetsp:Transcript_34104/g.109424  ORF Transcript_34104/g.109424 Transcript_34104/m.109424 type:complete len:208 (+) Transcript_34104:1617-2240(+)
MGWPSSRGVVPTGYPWVKVCSLATGMSLMSVASTSPSSSLGSSATASSSKVASARGDCVDEARTSTEGRSRLRRSTRRTTPLQQAQVKRTSTREMIPMTPVADVESEHSSSKASTQQDVHRTEGVHESDTRHFWHPSTSSTHRNDEFVKHPPFGANAPKQQFSAMVTSSSNNDRRRTRPPTEEENIISPKEGPGFERRLRNTQGRVA